MRTDFYARLVAACCRHAAAVVVAGAIAGLIACVYVVQNFQMDSNSENLFSPDIGWRQRQAEFEAAFPQRIDLTLAVIDGVTPERTVEAATTLTAALAARKDLFRSVRDRADSDFFTHNGLLFLTPDEVRDTTRNVIDAQPFLGPLAADPSLRGIMDGFSAALLGIENGATSLEDLAGPFSVFSDTLDEINAGKPAFLSWQELISGEKPGARDTRRIIEIQAALNYGALAPGATASTELRKIAADLGLTPANGVTVRLTGSVPITDEEFLTLTDRAALMATLMMSAILATLWAAVRSAKIVAAILITLLTGLAITTAIGLAAVGRFNVISVAFIPLFVGIGVDFGIQYSVRYRAERHQKRDLIPALTQAGAIMGPPLTLAALATAACFYSFAPTSFAGVAELGFIAGNGMIIAYLLSGTLLPALLKLMHPKGEAGEIGIAQLAGADRFVHKYRRAIVAGLSALTVAGLFLLPSLEFDDNPMNLRRVSTESIATLFDLMKDPVTSPNTIEILAPSLDEARDLTARVEQLPDVDHATTLDSFIPTGQEEKLALVSDAAFLLDTTINPFDIKPPPNQEEILASIGTTSADLRRVASNGSMPAAGVALRLAAALDSLAGEGGTALDRAEAAFVPGLKTMLERLRAILSPRPVDMNAIPNELKADWLAQDGRARVQVSFRGDPNDRPTLRRFAEAVRAIAPNATGAPITMMESGRIVVGAFVQAGLLSLLAVVVLLAITLRSARDVVLTLGPLLAACALTFATCVLLGLPLNFANIIVLPLLLGIGVAFHIYFVMAWRAGGHNFLQSSLSRAVLFSALTTATGFGTLWLSRHPGTASMGELLMISLAWTLTILVLLPALLETAKPD
jgi:hopanoid biosynthesis associated RND transporter like protein HpnN